MDTATATQYLNLTAALITVGSVVFIIQHILKWRNSPRFSVGVLPSVKEQKEEGLSPIGKSSHIDEFCFDKRFLAKQLRNDTELSSLEFDNDSARSLSPNSATHIKLPIIIQNNGKSIAKDYLMVLSFSHPEIRVVDIHTEALEIECLYTQDDSFIENKKLAEHLPALELRNIYRELNLISDYLSLKGSLTSGSFEAISLKLHVPKQCQNFTILFKLDCADFFNYERQVWGQHINIFRDKK